VVWTKIRSLGVQVSFNIVADASFSTTPSFQGKPGGVYFFFDGAAIGRNNSFLFLPQKIDLSSYFDAEFRKRELETFARLPSDLAKQVQPAGIPQEEKPPPKHDRHYNRGK
jgi:hypothetical protein